MGLHDPVDALVVARLAPCHDSLPAQHCPDPAIAVGGHVRDDGLDLGQQIVFRLRPTADPLLCPAADALGHIGTGNFQSFAHRLHREPPLGSDNDRSSCFFEPVETSSASFKISASSVFLPSSRCNSRTWLCRARYSEAATTSSSLPAA